MGDDTPPVTIFSPFNLSAAIVGQQIVPGDTTSTVDLGYVIHYPYQACMPRRLSPYAGPW